MPVVVVALVASIVTKYEGGTYIDVYALRDQ